jgi:hypothetical protein
VIAGAVIVVSVAIIVTTRGRMHAPRPERDSQAVSASVAVNPTTEPASTR